VSLHVDDLVELTAERPVAGGRMLARHEGQVVLVAGAIPAERVRARISRVAKQVAWADTVDVLAASGDRRAAFCDPLCGGTGYAHIAYERQLRLKGEVIADAFQRLAKRPLEQPPSVRSSPDRGYRMRARLHVRAGRATFFREGSHSTCDPRTTGQLRADAVDAADAVLDALKDRAGDCEAVVVAENVAGTERALHLEPRPEAGLDDLAIALPAGATGVTTVAASPAQHRPGASEAIVIVALAGRPTIVDSARDLLGDQAAIDRSLTWTRHAASFFQANRFLVGALVQRVLEAAAGESCVDLYAGVGLFSAALAAGGARVVAVEGDSVSTADLRINAAPWVDRLRVAAMPVERFLRSPGIAPPDVVVLDPPRTGVDARALNSLLEWGVRRVVYVSCDPPTMARDAARLFGAGYGLQAIDAFDLFPNTPHVEAVGVFEK